MNSAGRRRAKCQEREDEHARSDAGEQSKRCRDLNLCVPEGLVTSGKKVFTDIMTENLHSASSGEGFYPDLPHQVTFLLTVHLSVQAKKKRV